MKLSLQHLAVAVADGDDKRQLC